MTVLRKVSSSYNHNKVAPGEAQEQKRTRVPLPHEVVMEKFGIPEPEKEFKKQLSRNERWNIFLNFLKILKKEGRYGVHDFVSEQRSYTVNVMFDSREDAKIFEQQYYSELLNSGKKYLQDKGEDPKTWNISFVTTLKDSENKKNLIFQIV